MPILEALCRGAVFSVFAIALAGKLAAPAAARDAVAGFGVPWPRLGAALLLAGEACALVLLLVAPVAGYALVLALLVAFVAAMVRALRAGSRVSCKCFGASERPIGAAHLVRNALLIALATTGLVAAALAGTAPTATWALAAVLGAALGAVITRWDDLAYLVAGR